MSIFGGLGKAWDKLTTPEAKGSSMVPGVLVQLSKASSNEGYFVHIHSLGTNPDYPDKGEVGLFGFQKTSGAQRYESGFQFISDNDDYTRFVLDEVQKGKDTVLQLTAYARGVDGKEKVISQPTVKVAKPSTPAVEAAPEPVGA